MDKIEIVTSMTDKELMSKLDDIISLAQTKGNTQVVLYLYEIQKRYKRMLKEE